MSTQFEASVNVFRALVSNTNHVFGPDTLHAAQAHHALCQPLFCIGDLDGALEHAELGASIFVKRLGKEDELSKEAETLAEAFKNAKAQQVMSAQQKQQQQGSAAGASQQQQNVLPPAQQRKLIQQRAQAQAQAAAAAQQQQAASTSTSTRRKLSAAELSARAKATQEQEAREKAQSQIGSVGHLEVSFSCPVAYLKHPFFVDFFPLGYAFSSRSKILMIHPAFPPLLSFSCFPNQVDDLVKFVTGTKSKPRVLKQKKRTT